MPKRWHTFQPGDKRPPKEEEEDDEHTGEAVPDDIVKPPGIENKESPPFSTLAELFTNIETAMKGKGKFKTKKEQIVIFMTTWRARVGPDLYPAIRLMLPDRDNRRRSYGLKEQKLAKAYSSALDLPPHSKDHLTLENWKVPTKDDAAVGELSIVAMDVIKSRSSVIVGCWSVDQVNEVLDRLSQVSSFVAKSVPKRSPSAVVASILKECLANMTAKEQKWLIRIILRDLKLGLGEKQVFNAFHEDAMDVFNTCSDILRVCWKLHDPSYRLPNEDSHLKPGAVFRPMLCSRNTRDLSDIVKAMTKKGRIEDKDGTSEYAKSAASEFYYAPDEFIIEEKLDGERIQLHKKGDVYQYNSRKSHDYTYLYGKDKKSGSLTQFIDRLFFSGVEDVIIDGEMLVYDPKTDRYIPFGTLKSFAHLTEFSDTDSRPCFKVFDVLYIKMKGQEPVNLLNTPLRERKKALSRLITPLKGTIEIVETKKAKSTDEISTTLAYIVETKGEGIVVKNPESKYILGGRTDTWVKVKPDYMDELGETIDALVIGGYWGQGGRGGMHSSFLVGLRDDSLPKVDDQPVFKSFAKFGTGFSMETFKWVQEHTKDKWLPCDKQRKESLPKWFQTNGEYPDQLIKPTDSFVVKIKAAELVGGVDYGTQITLRFPRALEVRYDMGAEDCMDIVDVREMRTKAGSKRVVGDDLRTKHKKVKLVGGKSRAVSAGVGKVEVIADFFKDIVFFVSQVSSESGSDKAKVERLIVEHGGSIIQTIPPATATQRVVIASKMTAKLKATKSQADVDLVLPEWVIKSAEQGRKLALRECFYLRALDSTKESAEYNLEVDEEEVTPATLDEDVAIDEAEDEDFKNLDDAAERANGIDEEPDTESEAGGMDDWENESEKEEDDTDKPATINDPLSLTDAAPGLGSGAPVVAFDPALLFGNYIAYFDTAHNAELNQLGQSQASGEKQKLTDEELKVTASKFEAYGGGVTTDLDDPGLTHIVVHKRMAQHRYVELLQRTSQPRLRRIVTHDWITNSIIESSLENEQSYTPTTS